MSAPVPPALPQTYLAGPTIVMRGLHERDAAWAGRWRPSRFPLSPDRAGEAVREEAILNRNGRRFTLVACRPDDDRPLGSTMIWFDNPLWAFVTFHTWPALGDAHRERLETEMLELIVPFLQQEHHLAAVLVECLGTRTRMQEGAVALGMRPAFRLREAAWRDGRWDDVLGFEALSREGLALFGTPPEPVFGPVDREARSPAPRRWPVLDDPPEHAIIANERLYLRALTADDADRMAQCARQETETFFEPRWPRSQLLAADFHRSAGASEPPDNLRFAICLRQSGDLIGANGLIGLDLIDQTAETESEIFLAEHRGRGFGTEAKHLLLSYAFDRLGLHSVRSYVWNRNPRSAAALRKQGYREAGAITWRQFMGKPVGDWVFDLLAEEWQAARR
jgi:RimJ/RimL family protein N-acetyltransferase